jgi:methylthioribose-1-phosphate isomerase
MPAHDTIRAIQWCDDHMKLLDQRRLPAEQLYLDVRNAGEAAQAIRDMVVRGAPAIGITAGYAVVLAAQERFRQSPESWQQLVESDLELLAASRPTAVNLFWAIQRMRKVIDCVVDNPVTPLLEAAKEIHQQDVAANHTMGRLGAAFIEPGQSVLTHCNTGSLATGGYGTALGVIRSAYSDNKLNQVFADETRPWLQGSRLTAWELMQDGIPVTLIADSAAGYLMQQGKVQWVIVGADRITANGDVANKIGTYNLAVNARYHGVKFMVVAPTSTIDWSLTDGTSIPIEQRLPDEVLSFHGQPVSPANASAWNPAFDVTPASLVDVIVTEQGTVTSPGQESMVAMRKKPE